MTAKELSADRRARKGVLYQSRRVGSALIPKPLNYPALCRHGSSIKRGMAHGLNGTNIVQFG